MLARLSVALLIVASPILAAEPASEIKVDGSGQAYRIKKVCRTVEVSGSFIPRTSCVSKKVLIKAPEASAPQAEATPGGIENQAAKASEER